jgi:hypothetical protein
MLVMRKKYRPDVASGRQSLFGGAGSYADNLTANIQLQCERCVGLARKYAQLGNAGIYFKLMLDVHIKEGEAAIASGDVERMQGALRSLVQCEEAR